MLLLAAAQIAPPSAAQQRPSIHPQRDPFSRPTTHGPEYLRSSVSNRLPSAIADFDPANRRASFDVPVLLPERAVHDAPIFARRQIRPAPEDDWTFQWMPGSLIYKSYLAGVKESRFSGTVGAGRSNIVGNNWLLDGSLGARVGLFRYGTHHSMMAQGFQLDVEGAALLRMDLTDDMDVIATDYRIGVPFTYGHGNHQFKFAYYHLSSHLGDEFLIKRPGFTRLNYLRDVLVLGWSYYFNTDLRIYSEAGWAFKSDVSEPWEFQFGLDWAPGCPTGPHGGPFFAINTHLREELSFGGNITVQAGWAWRSDLNARLLRFGLQYYNGPSHQFSFYQFHENELSLGLWYDF